MTCPACEALGGPAQDRCACCSGTGIVTVEGRRAWLSANPPENRPSVCPSCNAAGVVLEQLGATRYRSSTCPCCRGSGVVTLARAREWRIAHAAGRINE